MSYRENKASFVTLAWVLLWASLLLTFLATLPGFSEYDTSKYLAIAQKMMSDHNYLLAYWDGGLYSDKPPLLFWLIIAGWKLFGVSNWWPQLIVLALATSSIFMCQQLVHALWPHAKGCRAVIPFILIGCFYWVWFAKEIRVDAILVLSTLLSLFGIIRSIQGKNWYWLLYIAGIGLGGFAKGPVILVFILLPAIFLPSLLQQNNNFSPKWYALLGAATIVGLCIPLAWAIPAALSAGHAFTHEIFYNQIAHRANQQRESVFFYLLRLPLWLLPWSIYPPVWRNLKLVKWRIRPAGETICLVIIICGLITFSVFGQKLPHYIYPLFPIFSILIARLCTLSADVKPRDQWPMATLLLAFALFCLLYTFISPWLPEHAYIRGYFLQEVNLSFWGSLFLTTAALVFTLKIKNQLPQIILISTVSVLITLFINNVVLSHYQSHLNATAVYHKLQQLPASNVAVIDGERIENPQINAYLQKHAIQPIINQQQLSQWRAKHPKGWLLTPRFADLKDSHQSVWYYQTRFGIIALVAPSPTVDQV